MYKGELTGSWEWDGGTVALLEVASDGGTEWIAAEPSMADDLLTLALDGESVQVRYEPWQIIREG